MIGAKGLAGAFRIEVLTDWPEHLAPGAEVYLEDDPAVHRIRDAEFGGRVPVISLEGVEARTAAEALSGRYLEADAAPLPEGSYYWHQLEGLTVIGESGRELGELVEVFRAGENEVYRVEGPDGEVLLPALRDVIREIDLDVGRMVVRYEAEEVG